MFTGLIQKTGKLTVRRATKSGLRLTIACAPWDSPLVIGESIAVNGACLTVAQTDQRSFTADLLHETILRANLGVKQIGDSLNLERALRAGDLLGGHMVAGHIDGIGKVTAYRPDHADWTLTIACAPELLRDMIIKGSIAVDGVSLTITNLDTRTFAVKLIPTTTAKTTLSRLKPGDTVNLETDLIAKQMRNHLETTIQKPTGLTWAKLRAAGF